MSRDTWERRFQVFGQTGSRAPTRRDMPSLFAPDALRHFPRSGTILDLGAGLGRDSRFFASLGYYVVSADIANSALRMSIDLTPETLKERVSFVSFDMSFGFPFHSNVFDVVYAHLSIHYFDRLTTLGVVAEIARVLTRGGVFAFLINSTSDPECGMGPEIENDYFFIKENDGEGPKRYFSIDSTKSFITAFDMVILDNQGEADFKVEHGVHNLVRFVGRKM